MNPSNPRKPLRPRILFFAATLALAPAAGLLRADPRADKSPWGVSSDPGDPLLPQSGGGWLRAFDEWGKAGAAWHFVRFSA